MGELGVVSPPLEMRLFPDGSSCAPIDPAVPPSSCAPIDPFAPHCSSCSPTDPDVPSFIQPCPDPAVSPFSGHSLFFRFSPIFPAVSPFLQMLPLRTPVMPRALTVTRHFPAPPTLPCLSQSPERPSRSRQSPAASGSRRRRRPMASVEGETTGGGHQWKALG